MKYTLTLLLLLSTLCYGQSDSEIHISDGKDMEASISLLDFEHHTTFVVSDSNKNLIVIDDSGMVVSDSLAAIKMLIKMYVHISKQLYEQMEKIQNLPETYSQQAIFIDTIPPDSSMPPDTIRDYYEWETSEPIKSHLKKG